MEPITCPTCGGEPVSFPAVFAGSYGCSTGHVFHRCLEHRCGVAGKSPMAGAPQSLPACTCPDEREQRGRPACPACGSILLRDGLRDRPLQVYCESCAAVSEYCQVHQKLHRNLTTHIRPKDWKCSCPSNRPPPALNLSRAVNSPFLQQDQ